MCFSYILDGLIQLNYVSRFREVFGIENVLEKRHAEVWSFTSHIILINKAGVQISRRSSALVLEIMSWINSITASKSHKGWCNVKQERHCSFFLLDNWTQSQISQETRNLKNVHNIKILAWFGLAPYYRSRWFKYLVKIIFNHVNFPIFLE